MGSLWLPRVTIGPKQAVLRRGLRDLGLDLPSVHGRQNPPVPEVVLKYRGTKSDFEGLVKALTAQSLSIDVSRSYSPREEEAQRLRQRQRQDKADFKEYVRQLRADGTKPDDLLYENWLLKRYPPETHLLLPAEVAEFIALAVVSGMTYDALKLAVTRGVQLYNSRGYAAGEVELLFDDEGSPANEQAPEAGGSEDESGTADDPKP